MTSTERPHEPEAVLDVRGVRTEYRTAHHRVEAVRDVSFTLRRGEKTAIVGESGSGKSALALSLMDLVQPPGEVLAGEVWLNGRDIRRLDRRARRSVRGNEIALIYQDPLGALNPVRTIGSQLAEALRCHQPTLGRREAKRRAIELLQEVEIPSAAKRAEDYPHHYSGGMRQRVMIAIALANDPSVLIADEPTTALDVTTQAQIFALLDRLVARRGTAIVLITHDLGVVARFCETVRVMYAGRLVEQASAGTLFSSPEHPYTRALLRSILRPDRRIESGLIPSIPGAPPNLAELGNSCAFAPRCDRSAGREDCLTRDPGDTVLAGGEQAAVVKCHEAAERAQRRNSEVPAA
jgi:oligopeptide/dipeptide ABC transporter ATP-binding protein